MEKITYENHRNECYFIHLLALARQMSIVEALDLTTSNNDPSKQRRLGGDNTIGEQVYFSMAESVYIETNEEMRPTVSGNDCGSSFASKTRPVETVIKYYDNGINCLQNKFSLQSLIFLKFPYVRTRDKFDLNFAIPMDRTFFIGFLINPT